MTRHHMLLRKLWLELWTKGGRWRDYTKKAGGNRPYLLLATRENYPEIALLSTKTLSTKY